MLKNLVAAATVLLALTASAQAQTADDFLGICSASEEFCEISSSDFRKWFPRAMAGDYQGQRNVSFCLANGCNGAVRTNRPLGCAWRWVIINSGSERVDSTDTEFFDAYCVKQLSAVEMAQMRAQAGSLFMRIYGRPLP